MTMDTLLQLLDQGLRGDSDALTFLERTASIYIFDGTNPRQPKTFGIWDFLNQALTEIERVESILMQSATRTSTLVNHVQLLATIAKRAAHRTFDVDRKNIQICLENAAQYHGSPDHARLLIQNNGEMRQRVMGRIAAIVFDYSYHLVSPHNLRFQSAFTHTVAMESLCALVAANTVSSSPNEVFNLVTELIIPGVQFLLMDDNQQHHHLSIPPFSAACLLYHIGIEAKGKTAPAGTRRLLKEHLFHSVLAKALAPILVESLRDSDLEADRDEFIPSSFDCATPSNAGFTTHHSLISSQFKIATMTLKALEMWVSITDATITQVILAFDESRISFIEVISEAMYSDSVSLLEVIATLLQVLFRHDSQDGKQKHIPMYNDDLQYQERLLTELVFAIGLQKNHFMEAQRQGLLGVCHALSNIASTTVAALCPFLNAGKRSIDECSGLIDLLALCASHPLLQICSISIAAFSSLSRLSHQLAIRILQILQSRAIIPPSLVGLPSPAISIDVDLEEFHSFRENILSDVLRSCYITSRSYYVESCVTAVEEFCTSASCQVETNVQLPFQLEAALYCLCAVAEDATKRALLHWVSPAAQNAAEKASFSIRNTGDMVLNTAVDAAKHDEQLTRCVTSLANFPILAYSNTLVLGQMCHFLHLYAHWISRTQSSEVLNKAVGLTINAFNHQARSACVSADLEESTDTSPIYPFSEAALALRIILKRTPERFSTLEALTTLEASWRLFHEKKNVGSCYIAVEFRKVFCSGICSVLTLLPVQDWSRSITILSQPSLQMMDSLIKIEQPTEHSTHVSSLSEQNLKCISEEIQILSIIINKFHSKAANFDTNTNEHFEDHEGVRLPLQNLLHVAWPCLCHVAKNYSWYEPIASSLFELLQATVMITDFGPTSPHVLGDFNELVSTILAKSSADSHVNTVISMIEYVVRLVDVFGARADAELKIDNSMSFLHNQSTFRAPIEAALHLAVNASKLTSSHDHNPDVSSGIFKLFSACIKSCPKILLNLPLVVGDHRRDGHLLAQIIERALTAVTDKEVDVAKQSMLFLRNTVQHCVILGRTENTEDSFIRSSLEPLMDDIRTELIHNLLYGVCGVFPQDLIDPAASLFLVVLYSSIDTGRLKEALLQTLNQDYFLIGSDAKTTVLTSVMRCIQVDEITPSASSFVLNLFTDLWCLHQIEDKDISLAESDDVIEFLQKYAER